MTEEITQEKLIELCQLINGKIMIPEGYTHPRCVVEGAPYGGSEKVQPYIFHEINKIIDAREGIIRQRGHIEKIKKECNERIKQGEFNEYIQKYTQQEKDEIHRLTEDAKWSRIYGEGEEINKAKKISEIIQK